MGAERHERISELFLKACTLEPDERAAFLDEVCSGDPELRSEVVALLAHDEHAGEVLETGRGAEVPATTDLADEPLPSTVPTQIGAFKILQSVGEGGMGVVYLARQESPVRRDVALKLIKAGMDTKQVIARFESERQALALMGHPNIARVFDAGATVEGRPYFAMEYVPGEPITTYCDRHRLATRERLDLFRQVCDGVQHAHQKGIIHRDIKPSNVLVTIQDDKPVPKIIDFGVAKATRERLTEKTMVTQMGVLIGTPEYMSPEQAEMGGLGIDTRTDVYSLGVLLYELLAGAPPFDQELRRASLDQMRRTIRESEPSRPSTRVSTLGDAAKTVARNRSTDPATLARRLRGDLDWITIKALEKDRTRRYGSPSDLAADIERHLRHEPVLASPPGTLYRAGKFVRRHKFGVAAAGLVLIALMIGLSGTTYGLLRARRAEVESRMEAEAAERVSQFLVGLFRVSDPGAARGNEVTAREILDEGAERIAVELKDQPRIEARLMDTIGDVYRNLGLYADSERLLARALARRREVLGDDHPDTLTTMDNLAAVYRLSAKYAEAEPLYLEILATRRRAFGVQHPDTPDAMTKLAIFYWTMGRYAEAEPLYREAHETQRRSLGPDHVDTLRSLHGLAILLCDQGKYAESEPLYLEAVEGHERVIGVEHPNSLIVKMNLANLYQRQRRLDESVALYLEVIEANRRVLGAEHPQTLMTMINLALIQNARGLHDEAEAVLLEVHDVQRRVLGAEHPDTLFSLDYLASVYVSQGRYDEAERLAAEVLEARRPILGDDHPDTLAAINELGGIYTLRGLYREADILLREALEGQTHVLGEDHPDLGCTFGNLARLAAAQDDRAQALEYLRRAGELGCSNLKLSSDSIWANLRGDPEFEALAVEIGDE